MADPDRIDRFEIVKHLGAGGFATVWLAHDPVLDLQVAVKVLADNWSRDPGFRSRFIEEAKVLWQTNSPRIVRVHHVGEMDDGRPYYVMAWANRGTLSERIDAHTKAGTTFTVPEACSIAAEVAWAVSDVHDGGRIHRDIKPANILITTVDSRSAVKIPGLAQDERLVLADFGLARKIDASAITFVSGSPAYVAPEQARGLDQLTEKVDLFPVGLIATQLLSGSLPTDRGSMQEAAERTTVDIAAHFQRCNVQVDRSIIDLVQRLLDPDPARRPSTATEVATAFQTAAEQGTTANALSAPNPQPTTQVVTPPTNPPDQVAAPTPPAKKKVLTIVAALALIAVVFGGGVALLLNNDGDTDTFVASAPVDDSESTTTTTTTTATSSTIAQSSELSTGPDAEFPLPDIAVVTTNEEASLVAVVAQPIPELVDFYFEQTHDGWTIELPDTTGDVTTFRLTSDTRTAAVTLSATAEGAGAGITQVTVDYEPL